MKKLSKRKRKWIEKTVANDRSYKLFLYNRFFLFLLSVLAQIFFSALFIYLFVYRSQYALVLQGCLAVLKLLFVFLILNDERRIPTKTGWIVLILLAPVFGVPTYLFFGRGRPTRKMRRRLENSRKETDERIKEVFGETAPIKPTSRAEMITAYIENCAGYPCYQSGEIEYYKSGEEMFPQMLAAIDGAEKFILLEYFIIAHGEMWQTLLKALLEKAEKGVQIRIIYDDFGCMMTLPPRYEKYLESLSPNIKCLTFNNVVPLLAMRMNNRDHRKLLVVDGKIGFTGGVNIADEYIGKKRRFGFWKDTGVKITGASVRSFTQMFFYVFNAFYSQKEDVAAYILPVSAFDGGLQKEKYCIQPYDDSPLDNENVAERVYADVIHRAKRYAYIFTPYLVLDDCLREALCGAALRGVDVRIVTPAVPDKKIVYRLTRANYGSLLSSGVKIYEYSAGFIHAKSIVSDDECAVVGTINFDYRSLYHHFENAVYFTEKTAIEKLKRDCEETFALSHERTKENYKRSFFGKLLDSLLRILETLL